MVWQQGWAKFAFNSRAGIWIGYTTQDAEMQWIGELTELPLTQTQHSNKKEEFLLVQHKLQRSIN